jgi:hypothetical protein
VFVRRNDEAHYALRSRATARPAALRPLPKSTHLHYAAHWAAADINNFAITDCYLNSIVGLALEVIFASGALVERRSFVAKKRTGVAQ